MSWLRSWVVATIVVTGCSTTPASAQARVGSQIRTEPAEVPARWGPLAISPEIRIANVGYNSNVFGESESRDDALTATVGPTCDAWLKLPRARVSGRTELDYVYYQNFSALDSWDTDNAVRGELLLGRFTPYFTTSLTSMRHGLSVEIDAPVRRVERASQAGVRLALSGKTSIGVQTIRLRTEFEGDSASESDRDLASVLNRTVEGEGASFRYAATPFTTVMLGIERQRERFESTPERDADSIWIGPVIEINPLAALSGRAEIGVRKRVFLDSQLPKYSGTAVHLDLRYTMLDRTQFLLQVDRDLSYSFRSQRQEYLLTGFDLSVVQRLADLWDVRATVGRARLTYSTDLTSTEAPPDVEHLLNYRLDLGYRVKHSRLGVYVNYRARTTDLSPNLAYDRFRIGSSLTYRFD